MSTADILKLKITTTGSGKVKAELLGMAKGLDSVDSKTKKTHKSMLSFNKVLSGLSVGAFVYFSQRALQAADDMSAMASRIGTTTDALQEFEYVGMQFNITQSNMDMGLQRLFRRFGDAQRGIGEATKMFQDLNVSLYDNEGQLKTNDQMFNDVADSIANMDSEAAQLSATVKLVDSEAAGMVDVFRAGSDEIVRLRLEAHAMGTVMSEDVVEKAAEANLKIETLSKVLKTQFTVALTELTPLLVDFGNKMATIAKDAGTLYEMGNKDTVNTKALSKKIDIINGDLEKLIALRDRIASGKHESVSDLLGQMMGGYAFGGADGLTEKIESRQKEVAQLMDRLMIENGKSFLKNMKAEEDALTAAATGPVIDPALLAKTTAELQVYRDQIGATAKELLTMQVRTKLQVDANTQLGDSMSQLIDSIIQEKEEQERLNQLKSDSTAIAETMLTPLERYTQQQSKLNEMLALGYITQDTFNRAIRQSGEDLEAAEYGQFFADLSEGAAQLQAATNSWASQFTDQLVEMAVTGKGSFSDLADSIIRDITRIAIQQAIMQPLMASFGFAAPAAVPIGTGKAAGGGVRAGTLTPINEMRDEILSKDGQDFLMLGAGDGYVHSNKPKARSTNGGSGATFNVNVVNKNEGTARVESVQENNNGGFDLEVIVDAIDGALARKQQVGSSSFGQTLMNTSGGNRATGGY